MSGMVFKIDENWCNYLYLNGIIDAEAGRDQQGRLISFCRFSSPFIKERLFNALTDHLAGERPSILALETMSDFRPMGSFSLIEKGIVAKNHPWQERNACKMLAF